jgi:hypothetical protein
VPLAAKTPLNLKIIIERMTGAREYEKCCGCHIGESPVKQLV